MTVNYISSETFLTANPTITIPVNCNCLVILSYSANTLTVGGNSVTTKATMEHYTACTVFELMNPPTGSQAVSVIGAAIRIFVYLNDAATCSIPYNAYAADGTLSGTLTSVLASELILLMTYDGTQFYELIVKLDDVAVPNVVYHDGVYLRSGYKMGLGANMTYYVFADNQDSIPVVYGQCGLIIVKIGTATASSQSNYVTFI